MSDWPWLLFIVSLLLLVAAASDGGIGCSVCNGEKCEDWRIRLDEGGTP